MMKLIQKVVRPVQNVEGATAVEYGLMVAAISAVIVLTVIALGATVNAAFAAVNGALAAL